MSATSVCSAWMFFFFKQKTAYEMRISDWCSDACSSDLHVCTIGNIAVADAPDDLRLGQIDQIVIALLVVAEPAIARIVLSRKPGALDLGRSEARRVGKECVRTCRSRWSPYQ